MANNCMYDLKVAGKKEDVEEFISELRYEAPRSFARIFSAESLDFGTLSDGRYYAYIGGDCAWSVYSCMFRGDIGTYASKDNELLDLAEESARLNLDVEIYSTETGIGFSEHYHYDCGEEIANEECDYHEYYYAPEAYESFDEFKKCYDIPETITEDDLENECYITGGFNYNFEIDGLLLPA